MNTEKDNEDWPWKAMTELADRLWADLLEGTRELMETAGEDTGSKLLFCTRAGQVAHGINARAEKAVKESYGHG